MVGSYFIFFLYLKCIINRVNLFFLVLLIIIFYLAYLEPFYIF